MSEPNNHNSKPARLVTFGSLINLNLEPDFVLFMYAEGFMDQRVKIKKFQPEGQADKSDDFSYCLFMILPFSNMSAFNY